MAQLELHKASTVGSLLIREENNVMDDSATKAQWDGVKGNLLDIGNRICWLPQGPTYRQSGGSRAGEALDESETPGTSDREMIGHCRPRWEEH